MTEEEIRTGERLKKILLGFTKKERADLVASVFIHNMDVMERMVKKKWLIEFYEEVMFGSIISNIDERIKQLKEKVM